jgi:hypothetical protein
MGGSPFYTVPPPLFHFANKKRMFQHLTNVMEETNLVLALNDMLQLDDIRSINSKREGIRESVHHLMQDMHMTHKFT